jgi:hypothetical protein
MARISEYNNEDLILWLAKIYDKETKKAFTDTERIAKELKKRGVINDIDYFITEWKK